MHPMPAAKTKEMNDYKADSDLRTLIEAEKIKKDKARHAAAMKKHAELMSAVEKIKEGSK
jgi:hypothetical protein